ncbi:MAG: hypothetical protein IPK50_08775 [Fibrobacterota bacterium]|nr:hypothetical protein [Fibrobacterota bacterium]QQS06975.1 MAG: hypothetical protein IPK50_08775 [Fibrobacterota bacterium]
MKTITISSSTLNKPWLPTLISVTGVFGWLLILKLLIPSESVNDFKEYLRQKDDQQHGEIWDLHFSTDASHAAVNANISYPESTIVLHSSYTQYDGTVISDSTFQYLPGRGMIIKDAHGGSFSPPGNTYGSWGVEGFCTGRVAARGYFPDSLKVEIKPDSGNSTVHWITGLKEAAPKKMTPSNRRRITIVYLGGDQFKTTITERPRLDLYSCSDYGDYCKTETWGTLLWKAFGT